MAVATRAPKKALKGRIPTDLHMRLMQRNLGVMKRGDVSWQYTRASQAKEMAEHLKENRIPHMVVMTRSREGENRAFIAYGNEGRIKAASEIVGDAGIGSLNDEQFRRLKSVLNVQ